MPFRIIQGNIVDMESDAIVNAANSLLLPGTGVCGTIFRSAGFIKLFIACRKIGYCKVGKAVVTEGYKLNVKKIIHTVGPHYSKNNKNIRELLYSCYQSSLRLAKEHRLSSISFPLISAGAYGYPPKEAFNIAVTAINDFLSTNDMEVYIVIYTQKLYNSLKEFDKEI